MADPITLEVFSDYVCPWCYLGDNRVKQLKDAYNVDIKLVHFPLHPETPAEGRTLADMFGVGDDEIAAKNARMQGMMQAEGLPFKDRSHTFNSRLAQEVGKWAETQDGGEAIHDKFFEAYFVDQRNIGDVEVILDIVKSAGLNVDEAAKVIEDRTFKDAIDADWAKSHQYGVTGVPTFVSAGPDGQLHGLVGAQPLEGLMQLMETVGAEKKAG
ncbi:MAG: DsbA family oxidoreductase [Rhodospirillales bacterium]